MGGRLTLFKEGNLEVIDDIGSLVKVNHNHLARIADASDPELRGNFHFQKCDLFKKIINDESDGYLEKIAQTRTLTKNDFDVWNSWVGHKSPLFKKSADYLIVEVKDVHDWILKINARAVKQTFPQEYHNLLLSEKLNSIDEINKSLSEVIVTAQRFIPILMTTPRNHEEWYEIIKQNLPEITKHSFFFGMTSDEVLHSFNQTIEKTGIKKSDFTHIEINPADPSFYDFVLDEMLDKLVKFNQALSEYSILLPPTGKLGDTWVAFYSCLINDSLNTLTKREYTPKTGRALIQFESSLRIIAKHLEGVTSSLGYKLDNIRHSYKQTYGDAENLLKEKGYTIHIIRHDDKYFKQREGFDGPLAGLKKA